MRVDTVDVSGIEERAYKDSVVLPTHELAQYLLDHLGERITTVGVGLADARQVRSWSGETANPHPDREQRLRLLYRAARCVIEAYSDQTAQAWLRSANPQLDDSPPLLVIADWDDQAAAQQAVVAAVRAFLEG